MAPKKVVELPPMLGRPGNHVSAGLVGLPNVGKSTTFNVLCSQNVAAENFPFCTIDPSTARVKVPDERFDMLCNKYQPASKVPAWLTVVDIAGLVKGAHAGEGLGNAFLSHIRATDAIFHVVRVFEEKDTGVTHTEGACDPMRDLDIIRAELRFKDMDAINNKIPDMQKEIKRDPKNKKAAESLATLETTLEWLKAGKDVRFAVNHYKWGYKEIDVLNELMLLTAKPAMYLVNMSEPDFLRQKNKFLGKVKAYVDEHCPGEALIPYSAEFEAKLAAMEDEGAREALLVEHKVRSQLPKVVKTGYHLLRLIHFFTAGADEVKCWTIRDPCKAPGAAGTIHTDFERGFIMAEVMHFDDWKEAGSEAQCKATGKYMQKGKEYIVEDGDICYFKFNVTADKKK
ncbi:hypothetical protein KFE25_010230 [Diacronema lutheri]|uniref:Obg-like ATPase 1 n=2 Tax=Diacronema lutheri TaxID=2081491 RepID=A0A8J5XIK2_DIALT|nr:hypothetical protein KFE25_010230 [Diacronema lutheri]